MSKSSIGMLVLFVALGVGWFLKDSGAEKAVNPPIVVEGFVTKDVSLQDVKILNKDDAAPYTKYEIKRDGETYVLEKEPGQDGRKHSEAKWSARRTYAGGKTMAAKGETYRVRMYAQTLSRSFRSSYSFEATEKDLAEYGLDAKRRIEVKATGGGKEVHLIIGNVDTPSADNESASKTWLMRPDVPRVVYQVAGFDLRKNFDVPFKDVRDRKILDVNIARIDKVELENPKDPLAKKVVATRPKLPEDQAEKLMLIAKESDKDKREKLEKELRKSNDGWKIVEPAGYAVGEIGSWLEGTERMSLTHSVDLVDGKIPAGSGLGPDDAVRITMYEGDKKTTILLGSAMEDGEKDVWVKLASDNTQAFRVASWSAEQVIKQLDDVRDTKLFGAANQDVIKAADNIVVDSPDGRFAARLIDGEWTARGVLADHKKVADFVSDLAGLDVDYESGKARSDVGLDKPEWQIEIQAKGKQFKVALAAKQGEDFFGAVGADGNTFKLQSWNADRVRKSGQHLKDSHLFAGLSPAAITAITVPDGTDKKVRIKRVGPAQWKSDAGGLKDAELDALSKALAEASWDKEVSDKPLAELGLDAPAHTVTIEAGKSRWELLIAAKDKDGNPYFGVRLGRKMITTGTLTSFSVGPLKKTWGDLKK